MSRFRASGRWLATASAVIVLVAAGFATREILSGPDRDVSADAPYLIAEAVHGTVEQSLQLSTTAAWSASRSFSMQASGIVTEVLHSDGDETAAGDVLFSVDLQPVFAAEGEVPAFRTLAEGSEGADVAQLQRFLAEAGHFTSEADGTFDYRTRWAVRAWQDETGVAVTGVVDDGTLIFLPDLPARIALAEDITVGSALSSGTEAVQMLPPSPDFTIELTDGHARKVEPGMDVDIAAGDTVWQAIITEVVLEENETFRAKLNAVEGESICGEDCGQIPLGEPTLFSSTIYTVPAVEGVTVPAAAVITDAAGGTAVVTEEGETIQVELLAGAGGIVVIEGVEAGQRVRVTGGAER